MTKIFEIQIKENNKRKKIGEIIYFKSQKTFKINVSPIEKKKELGKLFNEFLKQGIGHSGNMFLDKPIISDDPLFLMAVQNELFVKGYGMFEKNKGE